MGEGGLGRLGWRSGLAGLLAAYWRLGLASRLAACWRLGLAAARPVGRFGPVRPRPALPRPARIKVVAIGVASAPTAWLLRHARHSPLLLLCAFCCSESATQTPESLFF
jgi:hypothetical protein